MTFGYIYYMEIFLKNNLFRILHGNYACDPKQNFGKSRTNISINHEGVGNIEIVNAAIFHFIIFVSSIFNLSTIIIGKAKSFNTTISFPFHSFFLLSSCDH